MMVQLRWNCLPQALLLLILILGHLSMLIQVQLLFRMGGTSCVYTSDFLDFRKLTQCIYDMLQPPLSGNLKHYPITKHLYIWQPNIRIFTSGIRNSNYKQLHISYENILVLRLPGFQKRNFRIPYNSVRRDRCQQHKLLLSPLWKRDGNRAGKKLTGSGQRVK